MFGSASTGVQANGSVIGVAGFSSAGRGVRRHLGLRLSVAISPGDLRHCDSGRTAAPVLRRLDAHLRGELVVDSTGVLWLCKTNGTPGTWVQVSEQAAAGTPGPTGPHRTSRTSGTSGTSGSAGVSAPSFKVLPTPERFIDTRSALGGVQGPAARRHDVHVPDDRPQRRERERRAADPRLPPRSSSATSRSSAARASRSVRS